MNGSFTQEDLMRMPYRELQSLCKNLHLKAVGASEVLRERAAAVLFGSQAVPVAVPMTPIKTNPQAPALQTGLGLGASASSSQTSSLYYPYNIDSMIDYSSTVTPAAYMNTMANPTPLNYNYDMMLDPLAYHYNYLYTNPAAYSGAYTYNVNPSTLASHPVDPTNPNPVNFINSQASFQLPQEEVKPQQSHETKVVVDLINEEEEQGGDQGERDKSEAPRRVRQDDDDDYDEEDDDVSISRSMQSSTQSKSKARPYKKRRESEQSKLKKKIKKELEFKSNKKEQKQEQKERQKLLANAVTSTVAELFPKKHAKKLSNLVKSYAVHPSPLVQTWMECLEIMGQVPKPGATSEQIEELGKMPKELQELLSFSNGSDHNYVAFLPSTDELEAIWRESSWRRALSSLGWFPFGRPNYPEESEDITRAIDKKGLVISVTGGEDPVLVASSVVTYVEGCHRLLKKTRDDIKSGKIRVAAGEDPYRDLREEDLYKFVGKGKLAKQHVLSEIFPEYWSRWWKALDCWL